MMNLNLSICLLYIIFHIDISNYEYIMSIVILFYNLYCNTVSLTVSVSTNYYIFYANRFANNGKNLGRGYRQTFPE